MDFQQFYDNAKCANDYSSKEWHTLTVEAQIGVCADCPVKSACQAFGYRNHGDGEVYGGLLFQNGKPVEGGRLSRKVGRTSNLSKYNEYIKSPSFSPDEVVMLADFYASKNLPVPRIMKLLKIDNRYTFRRIIEVDANRPDVYAKIIESCPST